MPLTFKLTGFKEAHEKLKRLKKAQAKSIWRKGVRAASAVVLKAARPLTATESKTLRKSLALRIKARKKDGVIFGIIGARQKFQKDYKGKIRKPSKYSHLVEKGRKARVGFSFRRGPYMIRGVKANSFIGAAIKRSRGAALQAMQTKLAEELRYL